MKKNKAGSRSHRSLKRRILRNTTLNILLLVVVCCGIMALSLQSLANNILLDSLQPMARQAAKTVEANIHMLADRMMTIAGDPRLERPDPGTPAASVRSDRNAVLTEAAEIYELYSIALYYLDGQLVQGVGDAPENLDGSFLALLQETDNLTTHSSTVFQGKLGIMMGMPVRESGETVLYLVGVYKYDTLNDVISAINLGRHGTAFMASRDGTVTGHPDQEQVLRGSTLSQLSGGNDEASSRVITGETGATEFTIDGAKMLVAFSPIRGTQWSLVIQIPKSDYDHFINGAMLVAVFATAAFLAVSILLVLRLSQSISHPVKRVTDRMVALSGGDLHTEVIPVHTGDELEMLTTTLRDTVESVNRYICDIQQVLTQVAAGNLCIEPQVAYKGDFALIRSSLGTILQSMDETLSGFRAAADRLAGMAEELNGQSAQLYQASQAQTRSAGDLVHEVSHVKEQLDNVTESSGQTRSKSEEITQCVQEAGGRMSALTSAMNEISNNAQEITKIAKAIEDISFQTNILAINASVEAARAGEAGKGFAVVADEVKQLASKSAEAAQTATSVVENTSSVIQTGVRLTADTAGAFQAISTVSAQIGEISDRLVNAVHGQQSALSVMEERIAAISGIADQNLQNAGGTEQSSGLLAKEAEALRARVKKFALKEDRKG